MSDKELIERNGPGRREYDKLKCPNCDILWEHLTRDRKANREDLMSKISEVKTEVTAVDAKIEDQAKAHSLFVPRWMFGSFVTLIIVAGGWWFNSFTNTIEKSQREVKESLAVIHKRVSDTDNNREVLKDSLVELKWSVNGLSNRLGEVEKRLPRQ